MILTENISLLPYNTFGIDVTTKYFTTFSSIQELSELRLPETKIKTLVLGGGSNLLLTKNFEGLVMKNEIRGIEKIKEDDGFVYIRSGAGENWHKFVLHCIENGYAGAENLSLIPGSVGASPIQNIGAYGVEINDIFESLTAFHLQEKTNYTFTAKDCAFGYRDSIFKNKYKGQFVITYVTFRLRKQPVFNTSYGAIEKELERMGVTQRTIKNISQAVINIRTAKLPDPLTTHNAGSFFKNPLVDQATFQQLQTSFPNIIAHENHDGSMKLAAGWLIEQCGPQSGTSWKGYRVGDAGCYPQQALVLVNYGSASGQEIYDLSEAILQSVESKFGVMLEREVNVV